MLIQMLNEKTNFNAGNSAVKASWEDWWWSQHMLVIYWSFQQDRDNLLPDVVNHVWNIWDKPDATQDLVLIRN